MRKNTKLILLLTLTFVITAACNTNNSNLGNGLLHIRKEIVGEKIVIARTNINTEVSIKDNNITNSTEPIFGIPGNKEDVLTKIEVHNNNFEQLKNFVYLDDKNQLCINYEDYKIKRFKDLIFNLITVASFPVHIFNEEFKNINLKRNEIILLWNMIEVNDTTTKNYSDTFFFRMFDKQRLTEFDDYQYIIEGNNLYFYKVYYASNIGTKKVTFTFHPYDSMPEVSEIEVNVSLK